MVGLARNTLAMIFYFVIYRSYGYGLPLWNRAATHVPPRHYTFIPAASTCFPGIVRLASYGVGVTCRAASVRLCCVRVLLSWFASLADLRPSNGG